MSDNSFNERIRQKRRELGITQAVLAQKAGISHTLLGNIESGRIKKTSALPALAKALKVDVYWLETGAAPSYNLEPPQANPVYARLPDAETHTHASSMLDAANKILLEITKSLNNDRLVDLIAYASSLRNQPASQIKSRV
jgi:transcriptional regulator with XRE-family HTH domain